MGLLEKLKLVEEIPTEPNAFDEEYEIEYEETDAELSEVNKDSLISDIYIQNNLEDKSKSIFKVEDLIASLPKEMPTDSKRNTVTSALAVFNLTSVEVVDDGEKRIETLNAILNQIENNTGNEISNKETAIEEHKKEISQLEKEISDKKEEMKFSQDTIKTEVDKIENLINFIGGSR